MNQIILIHLLTHLIFHSYYDESYNLVMNILSFFASTLLIARAKQIILKEESNELSDEQNYEIIALTTISILLVQTEITNTTSRLTLPKMTTDHRPA